MKKRISVVLVLLGCALALTACGPKDSEKSTATTQMTTVTTAASSMTTAPEKETSGEETEVSKVKADGMQESVVEIEINASDLESGQSQVISKTIEVDTGDL